MILVNLYLISTIITTFLHIPVPDICGTPEDDCSAFATCTDTTPGAYTCSCNEGYTGDGKTCDGKIRKIFLKK